MRNSEKNYPRSYINDTVLICRHLLDLTPDAVACVSDSCISCDNTSRSEWGEEDPIISQRRSTLRTLICQCQLLPPTTLRLCYTPLLICLWHWVYTFQNVFKKFQKSVVDSGVARNGGLTVTEVDADLLYRSGTVNSYPVNSNFHLIRNFFEVSVNIYFFYHFMFKMHC